jgi:hypothetical protein
MRRHARIPFALLVASSFIACATADYPVGPPAGPPVGATLDVSYFHAQLSPYGEWVEAPSYGWVWSPRGVESAWRPYTHGHWAYSDDDGWLWVSDEEWGWATYHYGRWYSNAGRWFWVPGQEWAPAWVAWRTGGGYIGWAPLPPQAVFAAVGLTIAAAELDHLLEPRAYCFVDERHFGEERLVTRVVPAGGNVTIVNVTRNVTNYTVVQNRVVNRSLQVQDVEHAVGHAVPRYRVVESGASGPHRAQVQGSEVKVYSPTIHAPPAEHTPSVAVARAPAPNSGPEAERLRLEQKQFQEKADLEKRHTQQIHHPPAGVSMDQLKARQENEHRALEQKHEKEAQHAASHQANEDKKKKTK